MRRIIRKWTVLALAACLVFGLSVSAMAAEADAPVTSTFTFTNQGETENTESTGDNKNTENPGGTGTSGSIDDEESTGGTEADQLTGAVTDGTESEDVSLLSAKTNDVSITAYLVAVLAAAMLFALALGTGIVRRRSGKEGSDR